MRLRRSQRAEVQELVRAELHVELARTVAGSADRVRVDLAREADIAGAIDRLAGVCERLVERLDADRAERHELARAISGLTPARPRGSAVIGGTIDLRTPAPAEIALDDGAAVAGDGEPGELDPALGRQPFDWGG